MNFYGFAVICDLAVQLFTYFMVKGRTYCNALGDLNESKVRSVTVNAALQSLKICYKICGSCRS
jgi:hypothetical protein